MTRLYHLVAINDKTNKATQLTMYPMTHNECIVMRSKQSNKVPHVRIVLQEVRHDD